MFGLGEAMLGFLRRQVGLRTDAADANGSLHAKVKRLVTDYTTTRAGYLDRKISQSGIKSVQRGVVTGQTSETINISAVNLSKSFISCQGTGAYYGTDRQFISAKFGSANTLVVAARNADGSTAPVGFTVDWEVIEFY